MYFWNIIYAIFVQITKTRGFTTGGDINFYNLIISPWTHGQVYGYNLCLWYISTLFIVEIFNVIFRYTLKKMKVKNEYIFFTIFLILGFVGMHLVSLKYTKGIWLVLNRVLYFLPFYGLGILYNRKLEKHDKLRNLYYFTIIIIIQLIIISINKKNIVFTVSWLNDMKYSFYFPIIIGFTGIAFWLRICKILTPIFEKNKVVELISNNTYAIMAHQFFAFWIVKYMFGELSKINGFFSGFNWHSFKTSIWYYYVPQGLKQWLIVYVIVGIFIPILIDKGLRKIPIIKRII